MRHPLYQAALDADATFDELLVQTYGLKHAADARYYTPFAEPALQAAYQAKVAADGAWLGFMREDS